MTHATQEVIAGLERIKRELAEWTHEGDDAVLDRALALLRARAVETPHDAV